mmetsp:Transcript_29192/g.76422  ORF Transcript_29192/g.76422 Transcript_29192/m.76422 type:complete len:359 (+) Transcript_29192:2236-3312(+)
MPASRASVSSTDASACTRSSSVTYPAGALFLMILGKFTGPIDSSRCCRISFSSRILLRSASASNCAPANLRASSWAFFFLSSASRRASSAETSPEAANELALYKALSRSSCFLASAARRAAGDSTCPGTAVGWSCGGSATMADGDVSDSSVSSPSSPSSSSSWSNFAMSSSSRAASFNRTAWAASFSGCPSARSLAITDWACSSVIPANCGSTTAAAAVGLGMATVAAGLDVSWVSFIALTGPLASTTAPSSPSSLSSSVLSMEAMRRSSRVASFRRTYWATRFSAESSGISPSPITAVARSRSISGKSASSPGPGGSGLFGDSAVGDAAGAACALYSALSYGPVISSVRFGMMPQLS